jgi:glycosyltransferase involved in cell wall biosynthesis
MIVKNEAARIVRCLTSVVPFIDAYVIFDTGSTDDTLALIERFFDERGVPGEIHRGPFVNFEQARNSALAYARASTIPWDYLLLVDADMELVADDKAFRETLTAQAYDVVQKGGTLSYSNRRLIARSTTGKYVGVTHEYLAISGEELLHGIYFIDHADGANRKDKFSRDILLLVAALKKEPKNARYWFYLAQSYGDSGKHKGAIAAYRKRIELGGFAEEIYISHVKLAHSLLATGDDAGFIRTLLNAYNLRPTRAEAPWELAHYYRMKGKNMASLLFSEPILSLPYPDDVLFINRYAHTVGAAEEFSISAYYNIAKRQQGFDVCNKLALSKTEYTGARELARTNLFHYLKPLKELAPSFTPKRLEFVPMEAATAGPTGFHPTGYALLNPSVAVVNKEVYTTVRTVNYKMDKDGRYLVNNGEISADHPVRTRNYLAKLSNELEIQTVNEILPPLLPKPEYPMVLGFEDMRIFEWRGAMWSTSTVRELNKEGWCEQVLAKIDRSTTQPHIIEWSQMLPNRRQHEKNWMPWVDGANLRFAYRLDELVDSYGQPVNKSLLPFAVDHMSGSSQVIPFKGGWLGLVHEARYQVDKVTRYYQHRFVFFDAAYHARCISLPFVFHSKQIEFANGLARHPDRKRIIVSYGVADKEAWVATIDDHDLIEMLHP